MWVGSVGSIVKGEGKGGSSLSLGVSVKHQTKVYKSSYLKGGVYGYDEGYWLI